MGTFTARLPLIAGVITYRGFAFVVAVAAFAQVVDACTRLPAVAVALVAGIALSGLRNQLWLEPGLGMAVRPVLRVGVALLGVSISIGDIRSLGLSTAALTLGGMMLTLLLGSWLGRRMGEHPSPALVSAGAVAICGASACLAIAAALPRGQVHDRDLARTLAGITLVGSAGMFLYPWLGHVLGFSGTQLGILLGGSLHEVAQAVAAGFMVSDEAGRVATIVKMMRVACLGLVVLGIGLAQRRPGTLDEKKPPLVPHFLLVFLGLALAASAGLIPMPVVTACTELSRWCLLVAIAALGLKTAPADLGGRGVRPFLILVATSTFLASLLFAGLSIGIGS